MIESFSVVKEKQILSETIWIFFVCGYSLIKVVVIIDLQALDGGENILFFEPNNKKLLI